MQIFLNQCGSKLTHLWKIKIWWIFRTIGVKIFPIFSWTTWMLKYLMHIPQQTIFFYLMTTTLINSVKKRKKNDNFSSGLALNPTDVDTPSHISKTNQSLIDQCFMTKNQIVEWKVCLPPIEFDHNIIFHQSNLEMIGRNERDIYLEETRIFLRGRNSTGIRLLRTGDLRINKKIVMKCLQKLMKFFNVYLINIHLYRSVILQ